VIVAEEVVMPEDATFVMAGGFVNVVKLALGDKVVPPGLLVEATWRSYRVAAVKPVSTTE
jgi:hypothetical protein